MSAKVLMVTNFVPRLRITEEYLVELSNSFAAIEDEFSCTIGFLRQLRMYQERLLDMPSTARSQSFLDLAQKIDEMLGEKLLGAIQEMGMDLPGGRKITAPHKNL